MRPRLGAQARRVSALVCLLAAVIAQAAAQVDSKPLHITIGGASAGGFHSLLGESVAQMVRAEYPGSSVGYEPGNQAGQLVRAVAGKVQLAMETSVELQLARRGEAPFRRAYGADELPVLAKIIDHQDIVLLIAADVAKRYGVYSLADIAAKKPPLRLSIYPRGNLFGRRLMVDGILGAYGITADALAQWGGTAYPLASAETKRLMLDRKVDVWISAAFHPDAKTLEIARAIPLLPLGVDKAVIDRAARTFGIGTRYLPGGTYDFVPDDYYTPEVATFLLASPKLADDDAYRLARAIYRRFDRYRSAHPYFANLKRAMLAESDGYQRHPGAARFYREVGLIDAQGRPRGQDSDADSPAHPGDERAPPAGP